MMQKIIQGECLTVLKTLSDTSVQVVCTSPPYYGLRDYQTEVIIPGREDMPDCQHKWVKLPSESQFKAYCEWCDAFKQDQQIGLEETPEQYVEKLTAVFREVRRVLRDDGTLWLNLGDRFAEKQLLGVPWKVAFALQSDGWILRQAIIWHKPNALPEPVADRPTIDYEYIFLMAKSERYYYNADAIREPVSQSFLERWGTATPQRKNTTPQRKETRSVAGGGESCMGAHPLGRNKRSVWSINTAKYSEAHFAVMAPKIAELCILAGSKPGDIVLDPFSGAGTTAYIASKLGRASIGIELNPASVRLSQKRLANLAAGLWGFDEEIA